MVKVTLGFIKENPWILPFLLGLTLRSIFVFSSDFPINDGGMFFVMTKEIVENNFNIPFFTSYNLSQIPFAYPPLGFYLAGVIHHIFSVPLVDIFRFLPLAVSSLTILAFYKLSRKLLSKNTAILSTYVFALLPRSFEWQIMGGGITRSLGIFFSLLAINQIINLVGKSSARNIFLGIVFVVLTILSHLEWAFFFLLSLLPILLFLKKPRRFFWHVTVVFFGVVLGLLPWLAIVIGNHGIDPFLNFTRSGLVGATTLSYPQVLLFQITDEPFLTFAGVLGLLGIAMAFFKKMYWLPIWLILPIFLAPRSAPNLTSIPISILAGLFLAEMKNFFEGRMSRKVHQETVWQTGNGLIIPAVLIYLLVSTVSLLYVDGFYYFDSLGSARRESMDWVRENTDKNSRFLVISPYPDWSWGMDNLSEWFPALTERRSIATPNGREWLAPEFYQKIVLYRSFKECYDKGLYCLEEVAEKNGEEFDYIYLFKPSLGEADSAALLRKEVGGNNAYREVFANSDSAVFGK